MLELLAYLRANGFKTFIVSGGDLQMLQYTAVGDGPRFMLYVHHTDAEREWAYDRKSSIGHFDKGLDGAQGTQGRQVAQCCIKQTLDYLDPVQFGATLSIV